MSKQMNEQILTTHQVEAVAPQAPLQAYLEAIGEAGLFEGVGAHVELDARARQLLEALHHALAGGEVSVEIVSPGAPRLVDALEQQLEQASQAAGAEHTGSQIVAATP